MKIIIDMPEKAFNLLREKSTPDNIAESIIANGLSLPKGHGRLIDANELLKKAVSINNGDPDDDDSWEGLVNIKDVENAPTIIEAEGGTECK